MKWFEYAPDGVTLHIPWSEGSTVVLWLIGFGVLLVLLLWMFRSWPQQGGAFLRHLSKRMGLGKLSVWLTIPLALLWLALFLNLTYGMFWITLAIPGEAAKSITPEEHADLRWYLLSLTATTAALSAVVALPFTLLRTQFNRRQTETAEQSHITDQINKAVENLGATRVLHDAEGKQFTEPSLEVRIGALYALERISKHSEEDHVQIMEILCAYIRINAPASAAANTRAKTRSRLQSWARDLKPPREDLRIALEIAGRRKETFEMLKTGRVPSQAKHRLNLSDTNLQGSDLTALNLDKAVLSRSRLDGATLAKTYLRGVIARDATMTGVVVNDCRADGSNLTNVDLRASTVKRTNFWRSKLDNVDLEHAEISSVEWDKAFGNRVELPNGQAVPDEWTSLTDKQETNQAFREWLNRHREQ